MHMFLQLSLNCCRQCLVVPLPLTTRRDSDKFALSVLTVTISFSNTATYSLVYVNSLTLVE